VNRKDLQELSRVRAKEAKALLDAGLYDGAFYLAGYAVECALKACIAKRTARHEFPDKDRVNKSYTHKLDDLIKLAGLEESHAALVDSDPGFRRAWGFVKLWSEESRYRMTDPKVAEELVAAIMKRRDGILSWLRHYW
jgi:HEPN domain-containing protein